MRVCAAREGGDRGETRSQDPHVSRGTHEAVPSAPSPPRRAAIAPAVAPSGQHSRERVARAAEDDDVQRSRGRPTPTPTHPRASAAAGRPSHSVRPVPGLRGPPDRRLPPRPPRRPRPVARPGAPSHLLLGCGAKGVQGRPGPRRAALAGGRGREARRAGPPGRVQGPALPPPPPPGSRRLPAAGPGERERHILEEGRRAARSSRSALGAPPVATSATAASATPAGAHARTHARARKR